MEIIGAEMKTRDRHGEWGKVGKSNHTQYVGIRRVLHAYVCICLNEFSDRLRQYAIYIYLAPYLFYVVRSTIYYFSKGKPQGK